MAEKRSPRKSLLQHEMQVDEPHAKESRPEQPEDTPVSGTATPEPKKRGRRPGRPPKSVKKLKDGLDPDMPGEDDGTDTLVERELDPKGELKINQDGLLLGGTK